MSRRDDGRRAGGSGRPGRPGRGRALLLVAGLALAAWGLTVTLPHLGDPDPGYLAKALYPVLVWSLLAVACVAGLAYLVFRR